MSTPRFQASKGLTIIELLLVIALIAILAAGATPFLSSFVLRNNLDVTVDKTISTIRKAQQFSLERRGGSVWGVCLTGDLIRLYRDSCNSPAISEDFSYPSTTVTITGLNDTTFSAQRGEPSSALSITISSDLETETIQVNAAGGMEIN